MAIAQKSLGLVTVATPGTPQPLTATPTRAFQWLATPIKALPATANVGNIYLGTSAMVKATGVGVYRVITPTTLPVASGRLDDSVATWDLSQIYIDADNSTDGLLVGYEVS
jgi:hypothetical protein